MLSNNIQPNDDELKSGTLGSRQLRIEVTHSPSSFEELVDRMRDMGHHVDLLRMPHSGERLFGLLGRYQVDGCDCVVKIAGQQLTEDHPDYGETLVRYIAIQQEVEGLKGLDGLVPRLVGEIVVGADTVGVLRQFIEGMSLIDAVKDKLLAPKDAKKKVIELVKSINDRGFWLWDPEPQNLWFDANGRVLLIEGQCVISMTEDDHRDPDFSDKQNRIVEIIVRACLGEPER